MTRLPSCLYALLALCCTAATVEAQQPQTIAEKLAGVSAAKGELPPELQQYLQQVNRELKAQRTELARMYERVAKLYDEKADAKVYKELLDRINHTRGKIEKLEESWRQKAAGNLNVEPYALWHQPETTLADIIIDYGSQSYVYMIPPAIATMKISLDSSLPVPRGAWDEMLELILIQNGIGIRQLNPFLRELYILKDDRSPIVLITKQRSDLNALPPNARICFVLSPDPSEVRRLWFFLDRFVNSKTTTLQNIGRDILIVGTVSEVKELLKLYDFAVANHGERAYRLVPLKKADPEELGKVLNALFDQLRREGPPPFTVDPKTGRPMPPSPPPPSMESNGLQVIPIKAIASAVFLIGTPEEIKKAVKIIHDIESQIGGSREKVIFTYHVKHSNAEEVAKLVDKLYGLMIKTGARLAEEGPPRPPPGGPPGGPPGAPGTDVRQNQQTEQANRNVQLVAAPPPPPPLPADQVFGDSFYQRGNYVINPDPIGPLMPIGPKSREPERNNFLVDPKTNIILMVVEAESIPRLKELFAKIDVPKQMVQIDVLLFEKRMSQTSNGGLNLLRIGNTVASGEQDTGATFRDKAFDPLFAGVFTFFIKRKRTDNLPAYDLFYSFLISQQDIELNANPSVLTLNQTTALIAIQEEISVNTGEFLVDTATGQPALKDSFTRAQYGITIKVTPTVHMDDADSPLRIYGIGCPNNYVTLDSELTFDTIISNINNRPDVVRRKIVNQVRIPDGQSVILGGLRRKNSTDGRASIPFFGEIPGIGRLFSHTTLKTDDTEMFIILTPRIVSDPLNDLEMIKWQEMYRRPGDLPEFLCVLESARDWEKRELLRGTMMWLFGQGLPCCVPEIGACDSRCQQNCSIPPEIKEALKFELEKEAAELSPSGQAKVEAMVQEKVRERVQEIEKQKIEQRQHVEQMEEGYHGWR